MTVGKVRWVSAVSGSCEFSSKKWKLKKKIIEKILRKRKKKQANDGWWIAPTAAFVDIKKVILDHRLAAPQGTHIWAKIPLGSSRSANCETQISLTHLRPSIAECFASFQWREKGFCDATTQVSEKVCRLPKKKFFRNASLHPAASCCCETSPWSRFPLSIDVIQRAFHLTKRFQQNQFLWAVGMEGRGREKRKVWIDKFRLSEMSLRIVQQKQHSPESESRNKEEALRIVPIPVDV